jgi:hypothetical protein
LRVLTSVFLFPISQSTATPSRKLSLRKPVPSEESSMAYTPSGVNPDTISSEMPASASLGQDLLAGKAPQNTKGSYESGAPGLAPPSPVGGNRRISNAHSDYHNSVYDMYFDDVSDARHSRSTQHGGATSMRQSIVDGTPSAARHIEVTERADGSVVWQVIAGLADRSSTYSNSVLGFGHSRTTSKDSQFSYLNQSDTLTSPISSNKGGYSAADSLANEDGRSLFARTKGRSRQSNSYDDVDAVPPLPSIRGPNDGKIAPPLEFDMANTPGAAATRIVYTSDAELANMLDSLAGPDKSSAKFEFQRMINADGSTRPMSTWTSEEAAARGGGASGSTDGTHGTTNRESKDRIRIEAEIYSLLQREGHPSNVAASVAKQHADQGRSSTTISVTRSSM